MKFLLWTWSSPVSVCRAFSQTLWFANMHFFNLHSVFTLSKVGSSWVIFHGVHFVQKATYGVMVQLYLVLWGQLVPCWIWSFLKFCNIISLCRNFLHLFETDSKLNFFKQHTQTGNMVSVYLLLKSTKKYKNNKTIKSAKAAVCFLQLKTPMSNQKNHLEKVHVHVALIELDSTIHTKRNAKVSIFWLLGCNHFTLY